MYKYKAMIIFGMQNDLVNQLPEDQKNELIANIRNRINVYAKNDWFIMFVKKEYSSSYAERKLKNGEPVICVKGTPGAEILKELEIQDEMLDADITTITTENSSQILKVILKDYLVGYEDILLVGLRTDMEILLNGIVLRDIFPDYKIQLDTNCCAGTDYERHVMAIRSLREYGIEIIESQNHESKFAIKRDTPELSASIKLERAFNDLQDDVEEMSKELEKIQDDMDDLANSLMLLDQGVYFLSMKHFYMIAVMLVLAFLWVIAIFG